MHPLPLIGIVWLAIGAAVVAALYFGAAALGQQRWGRLVLLAGLVVLPLVVSAANLSHGFSESSRTRFCVSCHEMQRYGRSLFADNRGALSAVHYQNRLVDRDHTCYTCHADYALFGDVRAKLNGLRHVWVHYFGKIPEKISLYQPYPNGNCLHCHDDARSFQESPAHQPVAGSLHAGTTSCLECHNVAHDLSGVEAYRFWQAGDKP